MPMAIIPPAAATRLLFVFWKGQREEREDAAFALVVGPHDDREILHRDEREHAPDNEREHPDDLPIGAQAVVQALLEGVEHARADVAIDHAEGADGTGERGRRAGLVHERGRLADAGIASNSIVRRRYFPRVDRARGFA